MVMKYLNLGMNDPLTLGMAHPLADRLETISGRKAGAGTARSVTAALLLGVATLSAPLTIASDHPEEELAGKAYPKGLNHTSKYVRKIVTAKNGETESRHIEITVDGDKVKAFEIDEDGNKTIIDPEDIEGLDVKMLGGGNTFAFELDDNALKFMDGEEAAKWIGQNNKRKLVIRKHGQHSDHLFGDFDVVIPPGLHSKDGQFLFSQKDDGDFDLETFVLRSRMGSAESKLEAAQKLIRQAEKQGLSSRKVSKAKRELEKARRALKDAERALKDE